MEASPSTLPDVRERLFQIAVARFRREGYDGVPVSAVTAEAGVAKGTFFNHFPRKEHVLAEAFHRLVNEALGEAVGSGERGADAVLAFAAALGERIAGDRPLAEALLPRLSLLPAPTPDEPREEVRMREWIRGRLAETLPVSVPIRETDDETLAFLLEATLRTTLEDWGRGDGPTRPLPRLLRDRLGFLLGAAGLPVRAS